MTQEIYNERIVVYDYDNMGIICVSPSDEISSILCMGLLNSKWISITRNSEFEEHLKKINFDDLNINYQIQLSEPGINIIPMPDRLVTAEWIEKRKLTKSKRRALVSWEWLCRTAVSRVNHYYGWNNLMPFLIKELEQCNIETNTFSPSIIEWANIQEITPEIAFQELTMKIQGIGINYIQNYALYDKFARKITMSSSKDEILKNYDQALRNRKRAIN